jgi:RimJ/RimL family protein N-acetyltransferase
MMLLREFVEFHRPALEQDEVRHNLILGLLGRLLETDQGELRLWSLGAAGECAMQTTPRNAIVLGELTAAQCHALADETIDLAYPGVVGLDRTASNFVERAAKRGVKFGDPRPQLIQALRDRPNYPGIAGSARPVAAADIALFADWMTAFVKEATPHDAVPSRGRLETIATSGNYQFWTVDGDPVAMAGIVRRTRHAAAIAGVYTPPGLRRRGYGGAATAAVVDAVFAEGRTTACLYSNLLNPYSNRCYAKVGFNPVCRSSHYLRVQMSASDDPARL